MRVPSIETNDVHPLRYGLLGEECCTCADTGEGRKGC